MKKHIQIGVAMVAMGFAMSAMAEGDQAIPEDSLGLSKVSVDDSPAPSVVKYKEPDVGTVNKRSVRSYPTAPPTIPHTIEGMLPITLDVNMCKDCHVQPKQIGKKIAKCMPVPAPASHYIDVKKGELNLGRWSCVQCHQPQADVPPIVESTFGQRAKTHKAK